MGLTSKRTAAPDATSELEARVAAAERQLAGLRGIGSPTGGPFVAPNPEPQRTKTYAEALATEADAARGTYAQAVDRRLRGEGDQEALELALRAAEDHVREVEREFARAEGRAFDLAEVDAGLAQIRATVEKEKTR